MTFHSKSVAELGRLFVDLTDRLPREGLPATLQIIRNYFNAEGALLHIEWKLSGKHAHQELATEKGSKLTLENIVGVSGAATTPHRYISCKASFFDFEASSRYTIHLFRPDDQPEFDEDEKTLIELIIAQLCRQLQAIYNQTTADRERALYTSLVDRFEVGVVVLDRNGYAVSVSERANQFLEKRDGLMLINGRLCASNKTDDKKLQKLIRDTITKLSPDSVCRGMSVSKQTSEKKLSILLRHIPDIEYEWQGTVSLYIRDADTVPDIEAEMMRQIFDLTPAEAAVARRLATGLSLEDTAAALDITRNTARAHLRSIFSKSGIKRQTELVRLVLNSAVVL